MPLVPAPVDPALPSGVAHVVAGAAGVQADWVGAGPRQALACPP
jgi:hypothetical protein